MFLFGFKHIIKKGGKIDFSAHDNNATLFSTFCNDNKTKNHQNQKICWNMIYVVNISYIYTLYCIYINIYINICILSFN